MAFVFILLLSYFSGVSPHINDSEDSSSDLPLIQGDFKAALQAMEERVVKLETALISSAIQIQGVQELAIKNADLTADLKRSSEALQELQEWKKQFEGHTMLAKGKVVNSSMSTVDRNRKFWASQKAADGSPRSFALSAVEPHPWYKGYLGGSFLGLTLHIEGFTWYRGDVYTVSILQVVNGAEYIKQCGAYTIEGSGLYKKTVHCSYAGSGYKITAVRAGQNTRLVLYEVLLDVVLQ